MFDGLDDLEWPSAEVPGLIRGLVDPSPAIRERALEVLDLDGSAVTAVPFLLEALTTPGTPGRAGIAGLLTDLVRPPADEWLPIDEDERAAMERLLIDAAENLTGLLADPDSRLRAEAAWLLSTLAAASPGDTTRPVSASAGAVTRLAERTDVVARFAGRLGVEPDHEVRAVLVARLEHIAVRTGGLAGLGELITAAATVDHAGTALAALTAAARLDPLSVPVDDAAELLERAYADGTEPPAVHHGLGRLIASERPASRVERVVDELGPRVAERAMILERLLGSADGGLVGDALHATTKLIEHWRGDHGPLVARAAIHLGHPDQRIAGRTAAFLTRWGPHAAPAADLIVAYLDRYPLLGVLARTSDERALPALMDALNRPELPRDTGYLLAYFPRHADRVVAAILPLLPTSDSGLIHALGAFGPAAAPAVPALLAGPLTVDAAIALGRIGLAAGEALAALRAAATGADPWLAVAAAGAAWRVGGAPEEAAAWLAGRLDGPTAGAALEELMAIGPGAWGVLSALEELTAIRPDARGALPTVGVSDWRAALAWWRITGDPGRALPTLEEAWRREPGVRRAIAEEADGELAAALLPLFRAESDARQRSVGPVHEDERLLRAVRLPDED